MSLLMRAHDWAATPLGDPSGWPDELKIPLRALLTSRFEMWLGWGPDLLFLYNDAYIPTLGVKHPSMLARPFREVWAEVYENIADQVDRVRQGEATWNQALLLLLQRSGKAEETYHSFSYSPLFGRQGGVDGLLCIVSEETERVIGERQLETLRQLGMALVGAPDQEAVCNAVLSVFGVNRRDFPFALVHLASPHGSLRFAATDDANHLFDHPWPLDDLYASGIGGKVALPDEIGCPRGAWDRAPSEALIVPIPGPAEQRAVGALILGLNPYRKDDAHITDVARLVAGQLSGALANVAALNAERRRADRIWSHARDIIVVVNAEGILQSVSPAWTRILGHPAETVVGRHFEAFVLPEDLEVTQRALDQAVGNQDLIGFENRLGTKDGGFRWISWHTAMEAGLVYSYGRDVTDEKANEEALAATEAALRQAQKMEAVGQLTGGIAHDFNNLLTGISGSLELMQIRIAQGRTQDVERYVGTAVAATRRAAALTHRLLAFSRRQTLGPKPTDVNRLVAGMEEMIRRTVGPQINVETVGAAGLWTALCDPPQLENALLNLCINARDAMPDGGRITIETANKWLDARAARNLDMPPGQYLSLCVTDTGSGMPPEIIERVFEPFFTTKPIGQGTGLGLSMIYGFAKQSGGQVRIYSELGGGTTVCIYLPRYFGPIDGDETAPPTEKTAGNGDGETVLIVDDEPTVRLLVTDVLAELGYNAIEAVDSLAGMKILQSEVRIDLLITDVGLPGGMNGRQMADAGRAKRPELKVLFITGYAENAVLGNGYLEPGMQVMTKPFEMDGLAALIKDMIGR